MTKFLLTVAVGIASTITLLRIQDARQEDAKRASTPEQVAASANPVHTPPPSAKTQWKRDELVIVHGRVVRVDGNGALVKYDAPDPQAFASLITANTGAAETKQIASLAIRQDLQQYGPLKTMESGTLRDADWKPIQKIYGTIRLKGAPVYPNGTVNIIAAPIGGGIYTAQFRLEQEPRGAWAWSSSPAITTLIRPSRSVEMRSRRYSPSKA